MLYNTLYSGPKIDELLEAIGKIKKVDNGWTKMSSDEENPIDLNDLINPGNYSFEYSINLPTNKEYLSPVNVMITKEGHLIHQYVFSLGFNNNACSRYYNLNTKEFGSWIDEDIIPGVYIQETNPENPSANNIWINTSNKDSVIQYYDGIENDWKPLNSDNYMDPSIYNSSNIDISEGIYEYINKRTSNISGGDSPIDFTDHITDTSIHLTVDEKDSIDSKPIKSELIAAIELIADELANAIATNISQSGVDLSALESLMDKLIQSLNAHIQNATIHPSEDEINDWNSKAEKEHEHDISSITLDVSDIVGEFTLDMLPDSIKERQVQVSSTEELLNLTIEKIQNGDFVFLSSEETGNLLYIVIDDSQLGTLSAFRCINTPPREVSWDEISNKPTTLDELGVDYITNEEVDKNVNYLGTKSAYMSNIIPKLSGLLDIKDYANSMETLIDIIDIKMQYINNFLYEE